MPDTADCDHADLGPLLDSRAHDADELARRFRCMVTLGTQGDGFEKPLAASAAALDCDGPNAHLLATCGDATAPFLRPGAALAVVYVSDEDDCSFDLSADEEACSAGWDGESLCSIPRTENDGCGWYADALDPVEHYVDLLRAANPDAPAVTAVTLSGALFEPIDGQPVRFAPGQARPECLDEDGALTVNAECCPDGVCAGEMAPSCYGPSGWAFAGDRLQALSDAFPGSCALDGTCPSICDGDGPDTLAVDLRAKIDAALPPACE